MAKGEPISPRYKVLHLMRQAIREGISRTAFIREMTVKGTAYVRKQMIADWQSIKELSEKEGRLRYVARDRRPAEKTLAAVDWDLSKEYMYKVKVLSQLKPVEPITERFVNILSDNLLTPREIEEQVTERWGEWERYSGEGIKELQAWTAYKRVE